MMTSIPNLLHVVKRQRFHGFTWPVQARKEVVKEIDIDRNKRRKEVAGRKKEKERK